DVTVFLRTGAVDRRRLQAVVIAEREILLIEAARSLAAFELVGGGRALVGAQPVRRTAKADEGRWQARLEREHRLAAAGRGVLDVAVAKDRVTEQMIEGDAQDGDAQFVGVRPVQLHPL